MILTILRHFYGTHIFIINTVHRSQPTAYGQIVPENREMNQIVFKMSILMILIKFLQLVIDKNQYFYNLAFSNFDIQYIMKYLDYIYTFYQFYC